MKNWKRWLPLLGGVVLIVLLLRQIDPQDVVYLLLGADPRWILVGALWYILTNILRSYRFGVLLQLSGWRGPLRILPEMFAVSLLNNVLPSRTGELSFPYFLYRNHHISVGESTTVLILARIFDYLAVAVLFVVFAFLSLGDLKPQAADIVRIVALGLFLSGGLLLLAPWLGEAGFQLLDWIFKVDQQPDRRRSQFILKAQTQVITTLQRIRNLRVYLLTAGWSILIWLATFAWFSAFMQAIGLPRSYSTVVVGSTFASLAKALPFVTIGGFGAHEAGWTIGFSLTGMETAVAISSGFAVNILTLLTSLVFGGIALIYMSVHYRMATPTSDLNAAGAEDVSEPPDERTAKNGLKPQMDTD
jgi:uncharacterized protein (TIRG00374 family)